jgi:ABC-type antimicrobial peptide transport system permease subunit
MRLPGGGVLEPSLTYSYSEPPNGNGMRTVYTAATNNFSAAEFAALNRTYMATGFGVSSWKKVSGDGVSATKSLLAAAASTRELDGILRKIAGVTGDTKEGAIAKYTSWTIEKFYDIKETVGYVTAGFLALGGFVLAVSVINMIVSFLHGLDMRENYLGILRAMGATQKDIPKFFLAEVFTVLFYAFFIIIVVSVPLCIFMTELLAPVYNAVNYAQILPLTVYLGLQFIPLALLATGLLLAAFGFALAYALSYKKSKLPVTELLRQ